PVYEVVEREVPYHAPIFTVRVSVKGEETVDGVGASKRAAERAAAETLLERIATNE
ncbi:MAG: putative dsRNA-binding protein, partial [Pseudomonadota bacterium]|nr:putative dsRNA-binding protein [Pseudomonadota bacterium]